MAEPLTNIGTSTPPRVPPALPQRVKPGTGTALPVALPVARREGEDPGARVIAPDPLWISRWQPSATPPGRPRPWVIAYRWWVSGVAYQSRGLIDYYEINMRFNDGHEHYYRVPQHIYQEFVRLTTSVGQWLHRTLLSNGRDDTRYPSGQIAA